MKRINVLVITMACLLIVGSLAGCFFKNENKVTLPDKSGKTLKTLKSDSSASEPINTAQHKLNLPEFAELAFANLESQLSAHYSPGTIKDFTYHLESVNAEHCLISTYVPLGGEAIISKLLIDYNFATQTINHIIELENLLQAEVALQSAQYLDGRIWLALNNVEAGIEELNCHVGYVETKATDSFRQVLQLQTPKILIHACIWRQQDKCWLFVPSSNLKEPAQIYLLNPEGASLKKELPNDDATWPFLANTHGQAKTVLGYDLNSQLALLEISGENVKPLEINADLGLRFGEMLYPVGENWLLQTFGSENGSYQQYYIDSPTKTIFPLTKIPAGLELSYVQDIDSQTTLLVGHFPFSTQSFYYKLTYNALMNNQLEYAIESIDLPRFKNCLTHTFTRDERHLYLVAFDTTDNKILWQQIN